MKQNQKHAKKRTLFLAAFLTVLLAASLTVVTMAAAADEGTEGRRETEAYETPGVRGTKGAPEGQETRGIKEAYEGLRAQETEEAYEGLRTQKTKEAYGETEADGTKKVHKNTEMVFGGFPAAEAVKEIIQAKQAKEEDQQAALADMIDGKETKEMTETAKEAGRAVMPAVPDQEKTALQRVIACSEKDYDVLLRIVQAEAGGCDSRGRILVANVILNRVESPEFPDTITEVVYERSQFSPVNDGSINRCRVTQETIDAVDRALAGEDYSQGALYFMNRKGASSRNARWFDSRLDYLFRHENHEFFR